MIPEGTKIPQVDDWRCGAHAPEDATTKDNPVRYQCSVKDCHQIGTHVRNADCPACVHFIEKLGVDGFFPPHNTRHGPHCTCDSCF